MFLAYAIVCLMSNPAECTRINNQLRFETDAECREYIGGEGLISLSLYLMTAPEPYVIRGVNCEHETADSM